MRAANITESRTTGRDAPAAKAACIDSRTRRSWLAKISGGREFVAALMRTAFLSSLLVGTSAIHAQDLPLLNTLPVSIIAGNFVGAGNGQQFTLFGWTADKGYVFAGLTPIDMNLKSYTSPKRIANETSFSLFAQAKDQAQTFMLIKLVATTRRCLLTTIDPVLDQANETGRVIEVSSTLLRMAPYLSRSSNPATLCTMDSGKLALYFSAPGFDMVQLTAISYGTPSNALRTMSSQSVMFYMPLSKF